MNADCSLASLTHRRIQIMGASFILIMEHSDVYISFFFWKKKKRFYWNIVALQYCVIFLLS